MLRALLATIAISATIAGYCFGTVMGNGKVGTIAGGCSGIAIAAALNKIDKETRE